jgi:hypothetical protein
VVKLVQCSECGKEIKDNSAVKLEINGKEHFFHSHHIKNASFNNVLEEGKKKRFLRIPPKTLLRVIFNKTFAEAVAIGTGLGGIIYTLLDLTLRALFLDTISFIAAVTAMLIGLEHIQYLQKRFLVKNVIIFGGIGVVIMIILVVWHLGFRSNHF